MNHEHTLNHEHVSRFVFLKQVLALKHGYLEKFFINALKSD